MTRMSRRMLSVVVCLTVALVAPPVRAAELTQGFDAPIDRVWDVTRSVLKLQGWEIDKEDRTIGWIATKPRRVEGEEFGVGVERSVFKRERIMWIEKDEPMTVTDRNVEKGLLAAIEKSL